jgi:hypothetical protein
MRGNVVRAATTPTTDFTGALAMGASATLNLLLPLAIGAGGHSRCIVRHLVIASMEQLAWEVVFFSRKSFALSPIGSSAYLMSTQFSAGNSKQYGGSGPFYYQSTNIDLPYADHDFDDPTLPIADRVGGYLHLMLVNRSAIAKTAGPLGAIEIVCYLEPTYG